VSILYSYEQRPSLRVIIIESNVKAAKIIKTTVNRSNQWS